MLTACLHAPRNSLDLDRAFISKRMTLNWPSKYTGCLLIIRTFFKVTAYSLTQMHKYTKSLTVTS